MSRASAARITGAGEAFHGFAQETVCKADQQRTAARLAYMQFGWAAQRPKLFLLRPQYLAVLTTSLHGDSSHDSSGGERVGGPWGPRCCPGPRRQLGPNLPCQTLTLPSICINHGHREQWGEALGWDRDCVVRGLREGK